MAGIWLNCRSHAAGPAIRLSGVQFARRAIAQSTSFLRGRCHGDMLIGILITGGQVPDMEQQRGLCPKGQLDRDFALGIATSTGAEKAPRELTWPSLLLPTTPLRGQSNESRSTAGPVGHLERLGAADPPFRPALQGPDRRDGSDARAPGAQYRHLGRYCPG